MSKPFFITGLPRSRTAWFATIATTAISICHHEPTAGSLEPALKLWRGDSSYPYTGISDAALGLHLGRILSELRPQTLVIRRPIQEVAYSMFRYTDGWVDLDHRKLGEHLHAVEMQLDKFATHNRVLTIDYNSLHSTEVVKDCLAWLIPGCKPINLEQLMHMNIQSDVRYNVARARKILKG